MKKGRLDIYVGYKYNSDSHYGCAGFILKMGKEVVEVTKYSNTNGKRSEIHSLKNALENASKITNKINLYLSSTFLYKALTEKLERWFKNNFRNNKNIVLWNDINNLLKTLDYNIIKLEKYNSTSRKINLKCLQLLKDDSVHCVEDSIESPEVDKDSHYVISSMFQANKSRIEKSRKILNLNTNNSKDNQIKKADKKYELTNISIQWNDKTLYRIKALKSFGDVKKGKVGGYVEGEWNLSHEGDCWIYDEAKVYDEALIEDSVRVCKYVEVCGCARIKGQAILKDTAKVYDNANIRGNVIIFQYAEVFGSALVEGKSKILGEAIIYGKANIRGNSIVRGKSQIYGTAIVEGNSIIKQTAEICGNAIITGSYVAASKSYHSKGYFE